MNGRAISFGPFRQLQAAAAGGRQAGAARQRDFDILPFYEQARRQGWSAGRAVARAWPQAFVEGRTWVGQRLAPRSRRRPGGNRYVVTVVGRGYNFVAPVRIDEPSRPCRPDRPVGGGTTCRSP
jgi:hypothetical protein